MRIKTNYDLMFDADNRTAMVAVAMRNINAHQLAGLVKVMPELPERLMREFEVEVYEPEV